MKLRETPFTLMVRVASPGGGLEPGGGVDIFEQASIASTSIIMAECVFFTLTLTWWNIREKFSIN